jgi:hypothetical protein
MQWQGSFSQAEYVGKKTPCGCGSGLWRGAGSDQGDPGHANPESMAIFAHVQINSLRHAADRVTNRIAAALAGKLMETDQ